MSDRHVDDLLADLKSALDVQPSPRFAAGVRTRVGSPRPSFWSWRMVAAGAALAAAVVMTVVIFVRPRPSIEGLTGAATAAVSKPVTVPVPEPAAPLTPAPTSIARREPSRAAVRSPAASTAAPDPMAVVTDQAEILQRLWARAGAAAVSPEEFGRALETAAATEVVAIEIREIVVPPIGVLDTMGPLPVGALPVIRRVFESDSGRSPR